MTGKVGGMMLLSILMLAFALRFYDCSYPAVPWLDEGGHVAAAYSYWDDGQFGPDNWEHPPLRHILLRGSLAVFGDTPYGWRMRNILFGSLAALGAAVFALQVSGSRRAALLAGLLLATDPLHIVLSRYTWDEIYCGTFFLAAVLCFAMRSRNSLWFPLAALFMGCAMACKWYYIPAWLMLYLFAVMTHHNIRKPAEIMYVSSVWLFLPVCVYAMSYYQWFGRGYTWSEFIQFSINAYHSLQSYHLQEYDPRLLFLAHSAAWQWFVRPVAVGQGTFINTGTVECIIYMNSLPVWFLTLPALCSLSIIALKKRSVTLGLPVLIFCSTYLLYLFVKRPVFIYSSAPLLPFAFTMIAICIARVTERFNRRTFYAIALLLVGWNLYLYPLVTAKKVPLAPYRFLLEHTAVKFY